MCFIDIEQISNTVRQDWVGFITKNLLCLMEVKSCVTFMVGNGKDSVDVAAYLDTRNSLRKIRLSTQVPRVGSCSTTNFSTQFHCFFLLNDCQIFSRMFNWGTFLRSTNDIQMNRTTIWVLFLKYSPIWGKSNTNKLQEFKKLSGTYYI